MLDPATNPISLAILGAGVLIYLVYQWALPKPILGIPYNKVSSRRLLGDIPDLVAHVNKTQTLWPWIAAHAEQFNSPIFQLWTRPFAKPWVILYDFRESQDILLRRTKEFDRSDLFGQIFDGIVPDHHISRSSSDPRFKHNRALLKDLMTPAFLNDVAAPQIYSTVETLLELWNTKMRLAQGRAFSAESDIFHGALDAVYAATFGLTTEESVLYAQNQFLDSAKDITIPESTESSIKFPEAENPAKFEAILTLTESIEAAVKSPVPRLHYWFLKQLPYMRRAYRVKEDCIGTEIEKAVDRLSTGEKASRSALDDILRREQALAEKEGRATNYRSREIQDELFGFLIAGHDTTSTTLCWGLKYLSDTPAVQSRFRSALRLAFPAALAESRSPTAQEIATSHSAYIDAVIEEVVRTSQTATGVSRTALTDTTVLGHFIPKGTCIFMMRNGPDYLSPGFPIDERVRSESSRAMKGKPQQATRSWSGDAAQMRAFRPERWLVPDEAGVERFDANAGPHLLFGLGPRGCYGRRLAYLEMRLILVMIFWNFELKKCPVELSSYDAIDKLTEMPRQVYLRLEKTEI